MTERRWKIRGEVIDLSRRGLIMGILNVTPDSFSDGGEFYLTDAAVSRGLQMIEEGADIIDVGGESTRPGADPISAEEELRRILPVIQRLRERSDATLSIDTSKVAVAEAALGAGAAVVNDVTGGRDDKMMSLVAESGAGFIIMHMQGEPRTMQKDPRYLDVVSEVGDFFRQQFGRALECGVDPMNVAFDPGIGFGKTPDHNFELLNALPRLRVEGRPLVVGVSRKGFLAKVGGVAELEDRKTATVALTSLLRGRGADVFRVHDVKENVIALRMSDAVLDR
jgi:dihydropteroate synthase